MTSAPFSRRTCSMCQLGGREIVWNPAKELSPDPDVMRLTRRPAWRGHWLDPNPRA